jgi:predicted N-formylglutamate amidohydrolase
VHTFTPRLGDEIRNAEIGLLYDPKRSGERRFSRLWREAIGAAAPDLRVRMNYPYRGADDGLTTHLRRRFPASRYLGFELEVNQALAAGSITQRRRVGRAVTTSLRAVIGDS